MRQSPGQHALGAEGAEGVARLPEGKPRLCSKWGSGVAGAHLNCALPWIEPLTSASMDMMRGYAGPALEQALTTGPLGQPSPALLGMVKRSEKEEFIGFAGPGRMTV